MTKEESKKEEKSVTTNEQEVKKEEPKKEEAKKSSKKSFIVKDNLKHNGKFYEKGSEVDEKDEYFDVLNEKGFLEKK